MTKKDKTIATETKTKPATADEVQNLSSQLMRKAQFKPFMVWIIGDTPLITHAWSEKAKREMLQKQVKAPKAGKEAREPQTDFINSLYEMGEDAYGFPATGFKNCILSVAHKDKGIPRSEVMKALWINAEMVRTRPALAGAICDMPLIRIHGDKPKMREDMVKIGAGLNKTANLAYRAQFTIWACKITGRFNSDLLTIEQIAFLIDEAGLACGLGEWRNERKGMFGAFHRAEFEEADAWEKYLAKGGPIPVPRSMALAAE